MTGFNSVTLRGTFLNAPAVQETRNGFRLVEINLAVEEATKKDGQWGTKETVIPVTFFGEVMEDVATNYHAGDNVIVTGKVRSSASQSQDGREYYRLAISGTGIERISGVYGDNAGQQVQQVPVASAPAQYQHQQQMPSGLGRGQYAPRQSVQVNSNDVPF